MANVTQRVQQLRSAVYGKDVRESFATCIEDMNSQAEKADANSSQAVKDATTAIGTANTAAANATEKANLANKAAENATSVTATVQDKLDNGDFIGARGQTGPVGPVGPKGEQGDIGPSGGEPGKKGDTPTIGVNGNWHISGVDTGIMGDANQAVAGKIANNTTTTAAGFALDARQGKALQEQVTTLTSALSKKNYYFATGAVGDAHAAGNPGNPNFSIAFIGTLTATCQQNNLWKLDFDMIVTSLSNITPEVWAFGINRDMVKSVLGMPFSLTPIRGGNWTTSDSKGTSFEKYFGNGTVMFEKAQYWTFHRNYNAQNNTGQWGSSSGLYTTGNRFCGVCYGLEQ